MYPVMRGADYAAIERRAHELRREAMESLFNTAAGWLRRRVTALQDLVASVLLRHRRAADATFFEAQ